jgi:hypothetical protein
MPPPPPHMATKDEAEKNSVNPASALPLGRCLRLLLLLRAAYSSNDPPRVPLPQWNQLRQIPMLMNLKKKNQVTAMLLGRHDEGKVVLAQQRRSMTRKIQ